MTERESVDGDDVARTTWTSEGLTIAVTEAVATVTGRDPLSLAPLYETVETEALDRLLSESGVTVSFRYESTTVSLDSDGGLTVTRTE